MADPVPLTPAEVEGAAADTMVAGYFASGPSRGLHVMFAEDDPDLDDAVAAGVVEVTHTSAIVATP